MSEITVDYENFTWQAFIESMKVIIFGELGNVKEEAGTQTDTNPEEQTSSDEMVKSMAFDPIIFAMANPNPEITYPEAIEARQSLIMATGRSDYPNQINNVLGFPFIFRGALDVIATCINEDMKVAATYALANLAKQPVPEEVNIAYNEKNHTFGRNYIIPKPFDPR